MIFQRFGLSFLSLCLAVATTAICQDYEPVRLLMSQDAMQRRAAAQQLLNSRDLSLVPGMVDALFFTSKNSRAELVEVLQEFTGEQIGYDYYDWVELIGERSDLKPGPNYLEWKVSLLSRIDPTYQKVLYPDVPIRIRLEEIVWGGVKLDGIPALDRPPIVGVAQVNFSDSEKVFGVSAGGELRAYPLRYVSWHEMVNDDLGGEPITLSYCTLCNSGIAYSGRASDGKEYTFGTSGLLYRSNKLMYDRKTLSLWSNLLGQAVVGPLAQTSVRLNLLPVTLTTWGEWKRDHPETTVVYLDPQYGNRWGFRYVPGAAEQAREGVNFPIWLKNKTLNDKDEVYALRVGEHVRAYPSNVVIEKKVINDELGDQQVVIIGDPQSGAIRAYARNGHSFVPGISPVEIQDETARVWRITEENLISKETAQKLPRFPGFISLWFAWYGFFPQTEIYGTPIKN